MPQWLQDLGPEYYIQFGLILLSFILIIVMLIKQTKTNKILINRSIMVKDAIQKHQEGTRVVVDLANQSYVNAEIIEVGFYYQKSYIPIFEERFIIVARDFFKVEYSANELRTLLLGDKLKVKKLYVYVKNTVGDIIKVKAKFVRMYLIQTIKDEIKAAKLEAKKIRFETGNYNFGERTGLVLAAIFSPIYKFFKLIARKTNETLKKRQAKLEMIRQLNEEQKEAKEKETQKMVEEVQEKVKTKFQTKLEKQRQKEAVRLSRELETQAKKELEETEANEPSADENGPIDEPRNIEVDTIVEDDVEVVETTETEVQETQEKEEKTEEK